MVSCTFAKFTNLYKGHLSMNQIESFFPFFCRRQRMLHGSIFLVGEHDYHFRIFTLLGTNIAPENRPPGKGHSYWKPPFSLAMLVSGSVTASSNRKEFSKHIFAMNYMMSHDHTPRWFSKGSLPRIVSTFSGFWKSVNYDQRIQIFATQNFC